MQNPDGIDPEFYTLMAQTDFILASIRQLRSDPKPNMQELRMLSDQLTKIADQMEAMLPGSGERVKRDGSQKPFTVL